jgi:hypothetical protein
MVEKLFFGVIFAVCVVMLVRLVLGRSRQQRFDDAMRRAWFASKRFFFRVVRWRSSRKEAARAAEEAIRRAQQGVHRDGNVYRPRSFREPRKPH